MEQIQKSSVSYNNTVTRINHETETKFIVQNSNKNLSAHTS